MARTRSARCSTRASVKRARRLLDKYGLLTLWPDWKDAHGRRSGRFQGGASHEDPDAHRLVGDAMRVCGSIVLSSAQQEGAALPSAA